MYPVSPPGPAVTAAIRDDREALSEEGAALPGEQETLLNSKAKARNNLQQHREQHSTELSKAGGVAGTKTEQMDIVRSKSRTKRGKTRNQYSGRKRQRHSNEGY